MKAVLALIAIFAGCCAAQVPCTGGGEGHTNPADCVPAEKYFKVLATKTGWQLDKPAQPAPLKCGKYEHVEYDSCPPAQRRLDMATGAWSCTIKERSYCAPDLHTVTEREWQLLMNFLNQQLRENCRLSNRIDKKSPDPCDAKDAFK